MADSKDQAKPVDLNIGDDASKKISEADKRLAETIAETAHRTAAKTGGALEQQPVFQRVSPRLGQLIQSIAARAEGAMQTFRLPGTNRQVHDNREAGEKRGPKDVHEHQHAERQHQEKVRKEIQVREGRPEEVRERTYENYLAIKQMVAAEKDPAVVQKERQLSDFERLLIERFENAKKIEEASKDGKTSFLAKTVEQWRSFFAKFTHRTAARSAELAEIQEFLYRGMVKKSEAKAVLISDIILNDGRIDKFTRFSVLYQKISGLLSKLTPGDTISKAMLTDGLTTEKLMYLALQPPSLESEIFTGLRPKQGMFASEATEARVAQELGIGHDKGAPAAAERGLHGKGRKGRGRGILGLFMGSDEEYVDNSGGQFMPWWSWGDLKRPGNLGIRRALYSGIFIIFVLVFLFVIDRLLRK